MAHGQSSGDAFRYNMSSQIANVQLPPVKQPIGLFPPFIAKQTETLILKEKVFSLSGDSFDICLANGQPLIKVEGKVGTLSGRKKIYDVGGKYLFDIYKEHFHIHATYVVEVEGQGKVMEVKSSFKRKGPSVLSAPGGVLLTTITQLSAPRPRRPSPPLRASSIPSS